MSSDLMWELILRRAEELDAPFRSAEMVEWFGTEHADRRFSPNAIRTQLRDMAVNVVPPSMAADFPQRNAHMRLLWRDKPGIFRLYDPHSDPVVAAGRVA